jgi:hypothetical protein
LQNGNKVLLKYVQTNATTYDVPNEKEGLKILVYYSAQKSSVKGYLGHVSKQRADFNFPVL